MTLIEFVLARIAEDEAIARAHWHQHRWEIRRALLYSERYEVGPVREDDGALDISEARYFERWQPQRVLAECEAKRRIVEEFIDADQAVAGYDNDNPNNPPSYWQDWGTRHGLWSAVENLAAAYADHPDYRDEWKA